MYSRYTTKKESLRSIQHDVMRSRKVGNNTFEVIYKSGNRSIRLHTTDIIFFGATLYTINTGGWDTTTTKNRLNKWMPHNRIFQKDFKWYVDTDERYGYGVLDYYDGMRFKYSGEYIPETHNPIFYY